jgi:hypothetical protein
MLSCLSQINQLSGTNIIYVSGSSGEFFSFMLSEAFTDISKFHNKFSGQTNCYSHNDRVLFNDFFGRSLLTGTACNDDHDLVLKRINWYLEHSEPNSGMHLGIAHPHTEYLDFLDKYCCSWKSITITINNAASRIFCELSKQQKLQSGKIDNHYQNLSRCCKETNLNIEWQDFILESSDCVFVKLENFLEIKGNFSIFENMRRDYCERNHQLISRVLQQV